MNSLLRLRPLAALLVGLALVTTACGGDDDSAVDGAAAGTVIASVGDREFTAGELDDLLPDGSNTVSSRIAIVVENWMTAQAVELELIDRGYPITDEDRALATETVAGRTRNATEEAQLVNTIALTYVVGRWTEAEAADLDDPRPPNYLCANHLLVETEEEAIDALARHDGGEAFADLAIELSTGPSGPSGGDLGCAVEGSYVPEFEEAAYAVEAGEIAGPVETQFGWHLIEVESVGPATADVHPGADPAALAQIASEARDGLLNTMVFDLEGTAVANHFDDATLDPAIGTIADDSFVITPA